MGEAVQDTVTFRVGGEKFEVLQRTIRAKPDTLLCTLLDDPENKAQSKEIFVQADKQRLLNDLSLFLNISVCISIS